MRRSLLYIVVCIGLSHLAGCNGVGTVCENSGSTEECGDGKICTFARVPVTFDPDQDPPPPLSVCLRQCSTSADCGEAEVCRIVFCSAQKSCQTGPLQEPPSNVCGCEYEQDFESLNPAEADALSNDGWLYFGNVFDGTGAFKFGFGPFPAPTISGQVSAIATGEGGSLQGVQQLVVSSDYDCCQPDEGHFNGTDLVETVVFQEINPIPADFIGKTFEFRFDAKRGNIEGATTAQAFIRTQDPNAGFATTNNVVFDTTNLPNDWGRYSIELDLTDPLLESQTLHFGFSTIASNFEGAANFYDNAAFCASAVGGGTGGAGGTGGTGGIGGSGGAPACDSEARAYIQTLNPAAGFNRTNFVPFDTTDLPDTWGRYSIELDLTDPRLENQLLQVGFSATASNFEPSGVFYDNVQVDPNMQYTSNFEDPPYVQTDPDALGVDPSPPWGDGWLVFGNAFEADGQTFLYGYGPFPAPNNTGGFSGIDLGQGGVDQGDQVLVIISDYNNQDQAIGRRIEANTFRERTITADDLGNTLTFSFDAKRGNINEGCPTGGTGGTAGAGGAAGAGGTSGTGGTSGAGGTAGSGG